MSNKINDERLEDLQVYLSENDLTLENIRYSTKDGYYAFKEQNDDEIQTIGFIIYNLPQDIKDTLNLVRNIQVEEISELTQDYPVTAR